MQEEMNNEKAKKSTMTREKLMFGIPFNEKDENQKFEILHHTKSVKNDSPIGFTRKRNVPILERIIISPENKIYGAFKVFITLLCIISSFYYAYFAAFRYDVDGYWCPLPADMTPKRIA